MQRILWTMAFLTMSAAAQEPPAQQPEELGRVAWRRDFAAAQAEAIEQAKPLLVLFQEVPG